MAGIRDGWNQMFDRFLRYRTADSTNWNELTATIGTEIELKQLVAGERYQVQINTASHRVESADPIELQHTLCKQLAEEKTFIGGEN